MFKQKPQPRQANTRTTDTFRRNTVVISRSQRAVEQHKQSVSQRQLDAKKQHARQQRKRRFVIAACIVLVAVVLLRMRVSSITAVAQDPSIDLGQQAVQYQERAQLYMQGVPLGQRWLINADGLRTFVQKDFPEVETVYIDPQNPFSTDMHLRFEVRKPVFVWKGVDGATQYIDDRGVLFAYDHYSATRTGALPTVNDQGASSDSSGKVVIPAKIATAISLIYSKLPDAYGKSVKVTSVTLPRSAREIQAHISDSPYYIKFSAEEPIEEQVGELSQLLRYFSEHNVTPGEYIDLRVPHKAYYK